MTRTKWILIGLFTVVTLPIIYLSVWLLMVDVQVRDKFEKESFVKPTTYYSAAPRIELGQSLPERNLLKDLENYDYRQKEWGSTLRTADFAQTSGENCQKVYADAVKCIAFHHHLHKKIYIIAADETDKVLILLSVDPETNKPQNVDSVELFAQVFAQYLGTEPIIQKQVSLSRIPRLCLDAALAIEDPDFLNHQGVSFRGLLRAVLVNLKNFKLSQGGSTITQQLVKNYFLSAERTFTRKIKEMFMAFVVEARIPKDQILETYLNIIYLGQQGSYQIRGIGAASKFYFDKTPEQMDLADCALMAAIINSPGRFSPFRKPENALARREKVLNAMLEQNRILKEDFDQARGKPLPQKMTTEIKDTAPYFIEGAQRELVDKGFTDLSGYTVYTTMNLHYQEAAQKAIQTKLNEMESSSEYHKKNKSHSLQGILISSDPKTGEILAVVGGRDHRLSPFNRIFDSTRQVGSIFKPIVFLTALMKNENFNPMTPLENMPFDYKYEKKSWKPQNYDDTTYTEKTPAFYALKESLNVPTAHLAIDTGLKEVIRVAQDLGVTSNLQPFPSISLGAFEMKPIEVLKVYTTFARFGLPQELSLVRRLESGDGQTLYERKMDTSSEQIGNKEDFLILNSMLAETMNSGTGKSARASGLNAEAAGKTGTTSNYKDAWFAGFTSEQVAIVWMGYDDNTPVKLSGASGALPIWTQYMLNVYKGTTAPPLTWPEDTNTELLQISEQELMNAGVPVTKAVPTSIYIRKTQ
ncbi:MAG: penicillin-binding protein [Bdellovibrionaceae bacterium]|nr:penicillin-binding protein [Pseudobdellovibrionaceae bacterium]